ncbi:hypothetical protein OAT67_08140 [Bacteriovoracaceae bacterium]|nr:hypothetical protein [Bacteriovoracaceae bacterium]
MERFFAILSRVKFTQTYWDIENREMKFELIKSDLNVLSSGEASFLRFLAGVWSGYNILEFDYIKDFQNLNSALHKEYCLWVKDPFYP